MQFTVAPCGGMVRSQLCGRLQFKQDLENLCVYVDVSDGTSVALHAAPVQSRTHLCTSVLDKAKMKDEKIQADGGTEADAVVIECSYTAC